MILEGVIPLDGAALFVFGPSVVSNLWSISKQKMADINVAEASEEIKVTVKSPKDKKEITINKNANVKQVSGSSMVDGWLGIL